MFLRRVVATTFSTWTITLFKTYHLRVGDTEPYFNVNEFPKVCTPNCVSVKVTRNLARGATRAPMFGRVLSLYSSLQSSSFCAICFHGFYILTTSLMTELT
jgi:hypothetical protein